MSRDPHTENGKRDGQRGFNSYKCKRPIEYTRRCCRDALIQATLDPHIEAIWQTDASVKLPRDAFFAFAVQTRGKPCIVALCDFSSEDVFAAHGFAFGITRGRGTVLSEPALTTARTIWSRRDVQVPPLFSVRVLKRLAKEPTGLFLGDLEDDLVDEPRLWVDYVMALACRGQLHLDHRAALTHETIVSLAPPRALQRESFFAGLEASVGL